MNFRISSFMQKRGDELWSLVDQSGGLEACHIWTGLTRFTRGANRPHLSRDKFSFFVTTVMFYLDKKTLPKLNQVIEQTCGNTMCVNPRHFRIRCRKRITHSEHELVKPVSNELIVCPDCEEVATHPLCQEANRNWIAMPVPNKDNFQIKI